MIMCTRTAHSCRGGDGTHGTLATNGPLPTAKRLLVCMASEWPMPQRVGSDRLDGSFLHRYVPVTVRSLLRHVARLPSVPWGRRDRPGDHDGSRRNIISCCGCSWPAERHFLSGNTFWLCSKICCTAFDVPRGKTESIERTQNI